MPILVDTTHDARRGLGMGVATFDSEGVRLDLTIPDSLPGLELEVALAVGRVRGCSFKWSFADGGVVRWHIAEKPWVRQIRSIALRDLTVIVDAVKPAFAATFVRRRSDQHAKLDARHDEVARRFGLSPAPPTERPADLTLWMRHARRSDPNLDPALDRELKAVKRALRERPGLKTVDCRYAHRVAAAEHAMRSQKRRWT